MHVSVFCMFQTSTIISYTDYDDRLHKDLLYGELALGSQGVDRPRMLPDTGFQEATTENRTLWKQHVSHGLKQGESAMLNAAEDKRARRKASNENKEVTSTV